MCTQAVVTHQGSGCTTPPAWGGLTQGSWSLVWFTLRSWPSHPNNSPSTSAGTAPPSAPRPYVYRIPSHCLWFKCRINISAAVPRVEVLCLWSTNVSVGAVFSVCLFRLCLQEESIYLRPSCTPTWRGVGCGRSWWGEAKSWRWCRKTSTSAHTTRWGGAAELGSPQRSSVHRSTFV